MIETFRHHDQVDAALLGIDVPGAVSERVGGRPAPSTPTAAAWTGGSALPSRGTRLTGGRLWGRCRGRAASTLRRLRRDNRGTDGQCQAQGDEHAHHGDLSSW
jgi:hypothetical protein